MSTVTEIPTDVKRHADQKSEEPVNLDALAEQADSDYRAAVVAVAEGNPFSTDGRPLVEILVPAGRSVTQFRTDVETLRKRIDAAAVLSDKAAEAEVQSARAEVEKRENALRQLQQEIATRVNSARQQFNRAFARLDQLQHVRAHAMAQARTVLETTASPALKAKAKDLAHAHDPRAEAAQSKIANPVDGMSWRQV